MALIPLTEGGNAMAMMKDNEGDISRVQNETYGQIQRKMSEINADWSALSSKFVARRAPQSCQQLANSYYDVLGKTSAAIVTVGTEFSKAMSSYSQGDMGGMSKIVENLKGMDGKGMGSASKSVDDACAGADRALADVCDKFHLHKDFDIKPDGGNSSPFSLGG
jgi:hypothetical protein